MITRTRFKKGMPPSYSSSKIIPACYFHFLSTKDAKEKRNTRSSRVKRVYKLIRGSYLFYRASKKKEKDQRVTSAFN